MGKISAVFAAIDAAIQRKFDAVVFFFMRHCGLSKAIIRYALWALTITSMVGDLLLGWVDIHTEPVSVRVFFIALLALLVFIYLKLQAKEYRDDREAERRGVCSRTDIFSPITLAVGKGYFFFLLIRHLGKAAAILATTDFFGGGYAKLSRELPEIGFKLFFLSLLYLVRTPPTPPPREEKLKVLIPAREHSS